MKWTRSLGRQSCGWKDSNKIGLRVWRYGLDKHDYGAVQQQGVIAAMNFQV